MANSKSAIGLCALGLALTVHLIATHPAHASNRDHSLENKTVVITGASSGFGKGVALKMAARGANVVLAVAFEQEQKDQSCDRDAVCQRYTVVGSCGKS
ncbi:MAG: SDR family NAD(P)-dependent oxidoreductase [Terriglobales bacterium]